MGKTDPLMMRIVQVAPHPDWQNGIGDYAAWLIGELRRQDPRSSVVAPADILPRRSGAAPGDWCGREMPRTWVDIFLAAIDAAPTHLVHIHHGLFIGHGRDLSRFLAGLRTRRIPAVMTLHGVWPATRWRRWPARFYRLLAQNLDRVIIHQRAGSLEVLEQNGIPARQIAVIPHGTWDRTGVAPAAIPEEFRTPGRRVVLFAGNIFRRKGLHVAIKAFPEVVRSVPDACLLVVGRERMNNLVDWLYCRWLHALMRPGLEAGWLLRRAEYVSDDELFARIASAEVVVFPFLRRYGSASGVLHRALAFGKPVVCARIPTFAEAIDSWGTDLPELFPPPGDVAAWSRALVRLLTDEPSRRRATEASAALGRETAWPSVARQHLQLYRSLLPPAPRAGERERGGPHPGAEADGGIRPSTLV